jgi:hypothetical protein
MTTQRLHSNLAPIDLLTREELEQSLHQEFDYAQRERVRGVAYIRTIGQGINTGVGTFTIQGPDMGYVWAPKIVAFTLGAAGAFGLYIGDLVAPGHCVFAGNSLAIGTTNECVATWTSNTLLLNPGENLIVSSNQLLFNTYLITAVEVPAEMKGKLFI